MTKAGLLLCLPFSFLAFPIGPLVWLLLYWLMVIVPERKQQMQTLIKTQRQIAAGTRPFQPSPGQRGVWTTDSFGRPAVLFQTKDGPRLYYPPMRTRGSDGTTHG